MAKALTTEQEALDEVVAKLTKAMGKRWMVAVWSITNDEKGEPEKIEPVGRVTWRFPIGDFQKALELLKGSIEEEGSANELPVPPPLKLADFGKEEEEKPIPLDELKAVPAEFSDQVIEECLPKPEAHSGPELPKVIDIREYMDERGDNIGREDKP